MGTNLMKKLKHEEFHAKLLQYLIMIY